MRRGWKDALGSKDQSELAPYSRVDTIARPSRRFAGSGYRLRLRTLAGRILLVAL
jgi:hypothetical protein